MNMTFFIDESGNTGTNWLDKNQPYFIYGGWLFWDDKIQMAREYVHNIFSYSKAHELKASKILSNNKGINEFKNMFEYFIKELYALPIFGIVDKKYMIAAKIVETFFDHYYNPYVNGYLTFPSELKKALADFISQNMDIIEKFSDLIQNGTISIKEMKIIKEQLVILFRKNRHILVADTLEKLEERNFKDMIGEFESVTKSGREKKWITLTQTSLIELLKNVELISEQNNTKINVIHDELFGYDEVFKQVKEIFFKETKRNHIIPFGNKILLTNFPNIVDLQCQNSLNEIMIQTADLLCGFINKTVSLANKKSFDNSEQEIWRELIVLHDIYVKINIKIWNYYSDESFINIIANLVGEPPALQKTTYHEIIERDYHLAINK